MKQIFEEIKFVPGVLGVFVLHAKKGILGSSVPVVFKPEKLLEISRQLLKIYSVTRMNLKPMQDIALYFDGSVLVLRKVSELVFLVVICEPQVNTNMLNMSVGLAGEELLSKLNIPETAQTGAPTPKTLDEVRASAPLVPSLQRIEDNLATLMGPVAELVLDEALNEWFRGGGNSVDHLPRLVTILCREISDPDKCREFQAAIKP